jgi:hypothetical protein
VSELFRFQLVPRCFVTTLLSPSRFQALDHGSPPGTGSSRVGPRLAGTEATPETEEVEMPNVNVVPQDPSDVLG